MECMAVNIFDNRQHNCCTKSFKGKPHHLFTPEIRNYQDALRSWENLRFAKYSDVHSDCYYPSYKDIRMENYSFLDKLKTHIDKSEFIRKYCYYTGFPYISEVSKNIFNNFEACITKISHNLNLAYSNYNEPFKILDWGYDPTCSIALEKALPGSDLDKGYVIIQGCSDATANESFVNIFKGAMWDNLDQRIVSLNHADTFPNVYTEKQILQQLDELNNLSDSLLRDGKTPTMKESSLVALLSLPLMFSGISEKTCRNFMSLVYMFKNRKYLKIKFSDETNPYEAGKFNIDLAKMIQDSKKREEAKNFAFTIETVEANLKKCPKQKQSALFDAIKISPFVANSNVAQIGAWQKKIADGYLKTKLRNRSNLSVEFDQMAISEKYELIKDIIKYSSDDQSNKFSQYFKNDDDIKNRYQKLLNSLV